MPWATLSLKNLINALHEVDDWQGLGIQLDIEYCELQKIAEVHPTVERCKYAMLQFWLDKDVQVSWETLLVSLGKMNLKRIAEKIKKEFKIPSSTHSQGESPLVVSATAQSANVTTEDPLSTPPTAQPEQPLTSQSESVTMASPLTPPTDQPEQPLTSQSESVTMAPPLTPLTAQPEQPLTSQSESVTMASPLTPPTDQPEQPLTSQSESVTMAPPLTPLTAQPEQPLTSQSESVTMAPPLTPPTAQPDQTSTQRVRKVQKEIDKLEGMYDDLIKKTGISLSKRQAMSPDFLFEFRVSVAVLPTSLKYQHNYFLEHHSSKIGKASTVEEIFSILNKYCNFLNCSLLAHVISEFGDKELQEKLSSYMEALQAFRLQTRITDFFKAHTGTPNLPPEFVALKIRMGSEWEQCTLEDAEGYRKSMAKNSSTTDFTFYFMGGGPGSIYLVWSVSIYAVQFLVAAMDLEFLQHHSVEEVTIDGMELGEYKRQHYLYYHPEFTVISQHVEELSEGLIWASREGCLEDVVFLLSTGVEVNTRGQWEGRTALMLASAGGHVDVVKELLGARAGVDLQDESGMTALMRASLGGKTDVVRELLSAGAQVDLQDKSGMTALMRASLGGKTEVVRELLSAGAQVDLQDKNGYSALIWASLDGKTEVVRELLSAGAQVDLQDKSGYSALIWASYWGRTEVVRELLSAGAQVDLQTESGMTALMGASFWGRTEVVRELLSGGAKVDLQTENGQTALMFTVQNHHTEIVKALLAAGADVNLQEKTSGRSAVFYGAEKGDLEMVKLLIQGGANLRLKDKDGVTADEVAEVIGHHAVCEELRKHMHGDRRPLSKTVRDRVLATGQFLRALYKRLEERILRTQKKELARTQGLDPEIPFPSTRRKKGVRDPSKLRQQEEYVLPHLY